MRTKIRKVYVYLKMEITMDKLKAGDIFSMDPVSEEDEKYLDSKEIFRATEDSKPQVGKPEGYFEIQGNRLVIDESFGGKE